MDFLGGRLVNSITLLHRVCNKYINICLWPAHCSMIGPTEDKCIIPPKGQGGRC
jgi:hypothetical protein